MASAAVGDADADDGASGVRGGGELDVSGRAETTVGHLHDAGVGCGVASLAPLFFLIAATSGSSASACSSRASRSCATRASVAAWRGVASRERGGSRRAGDLDEVGAGGEHESLEGLTASKRRSAGGGADAGSVLGNAVEIDEVRAS